MHQLIITKVDTKNGSFNKVTCTENHYITSWNDGDPILEFNASTVVCCPLKIDIEATYRCITTEEFERLTKLREEAELARINEERMRENETK